MRLTLSHTWTLYFSFFLKKLLLNLWDPRYFTHELHKLNNNFKKFGDRKMTKGRCILCLFIYNFHYYFFLVNFFFLDNQLLKHASVILDMRSDAIRRTFSYSEEFEIFKKIEQLAKKMVEIKKNIKY
jgi:hypothetical protein